MDKLVAILKGLASMAVPLVEAVLESTIGSRLDLRKASVPKTASEATRSLLLLDPLSKDHWGSAGAFHAAVGRVCLVP